MALVHTDTGVVAVPLTRDEAQMLTAKIKGYVSQAWVMLVEAHDRLAHVALGYGTWEEYVKAEFDISRQHAYRLLDQGRVIAEIEAVVSPMGDISTEDIASVVNERKAREIKGDLDEFKEGLTEALNGAANIDVDALADAVDDELASLRDRKAKRDDDRKAITDLNEQARASGMQTDPEILAVLGSFNRLCVDIVALGDPRDFAARFRGELNADDVALAISASSWLSDFNCAAMEVK